MYLLCKEKYAINTRKCKRVKTAPLFLDQQTRPICMLHFKRLEKVNDVHCAGSMCYKKILHHFLYRLSMMILSKRTNEMMVIFSKQIFFIVTNIVDTFLWLT